jgi:pimeloyl-ACP methyl ester carboxylesterase
MPLVPTRDGQRLHVRVIGRGPRPVLLLHGLGSSGAQWLPFAWPLQREATFYLPDLRGGGRSLDVAFNQPDMFQNHAEDVEDIVRHFGLDDFLLGGHSMGATTSLHWLAAGGFGGVRGYLHIDQAPSVANREDWPHGLLGAGQEDYFDGLRALATLLDAHTDHAHVAMLPRSARDRAVELLARAQERLGSPLPAQALRAIGRVPALLRRVPLMSPRQMQGILGSYLQSRDYREALRRCPVPVTVMVGMRSVLYAPAGQMAIADYAPDVRIVPFERGGHLLPFEQPLKFLHELRRFIRQA